MSACIFLFYDYRLSELYMSSNRISYFRSLEFEITICEVRFLHLRFWDLGFPIFEFSTPALSNFIKCRLIVRFRITCSRCCFQATFVNYAYKLQFETACFKVQFYATCLNYLLKVKLHFKITIWCYYKKTLFRFEFDYLFKVSPLSYMFIVISLRCRFKSFC